MNLRYQTWRKFARLGGILAFPFALFLVFRPNFGPWTHWLEIAAYIFIFSLGGSGALLAILTRTGIVEFTYSDADKQTLGYKMSRQVAEMEMGQGRGFSDRYYENVGVKPPKEEVRNDKPVTRKKGLQLVMALAFFAMSVVAICFFGLNIYTAINGGKVVSTNIPFPVGKAGGYTLFVDQSQHAGSSQFEMMLAGNNQIISSYPIWGYVELKRDGEKYIAACNFNLPSPGMYRVITPGGQVMDNLVFAPKVSAGFLIATFAAFFISLSFFLIGLRFWSQRNGVS